MARHIFIMVWILLGINQSHAFDQGPLNQLFFKAINLNEKSADLQKTYEIQRELDGYSSDFGNYLVEMIESDQVITGYELDILARVLKLYYALNAKALTQAKNTRDALLLSFAQLESTRLTYEHYFKNGKLRRILKDRYTTLSSQQAYLKDLGEVFKRVENKSWQKSLRKGFRNLQAPRRGQLENRLGNTRSLRLIKKGQWIKFEKKSFLDTVIRSGERVVNFISGVFGNSAGAIRWRKGHLDNNEEIRKDLISRLKPLDIILERTPFALTDLFIPGNFGHAAIWLGTKSELIELGIWEHPIIQPFQKDIESGMNIIEAIRPGTGLTSMKRFLAIDEIAFMRQENVWEDKEEALQIYRRAFEQLGKDYDFNFDVTTTSKIVCSELIYHAFGKVNWPIEYILGRPTISPDNLAELLFFHETPVSLTYYVLAKEKWQPKKLNMDDLAPLIGFMRSPETGHFAKKKRVCKNIQTRLGNRLEKRRHCHTRYVEYNYQPKDIYDDLDLEPIY